MIKKTKTICTLGPSSENEEVIRRLIETGMNAARLNFSHGTYEEHKVKIDLVKRLREELDEPVAIILDTKGPEIRLGEFNEQINLEKGQRFTIVNEKIVGDKSKCSVSYENLYKYIKPDAKILLNDGLVELRVLVVDHQDIICEVKNAGYIASRKNLHVCGIELDFPPFTEKDKQDMLFGIENGIDFIAASFVQRPEDVAQIKKFLKENGGSSIKIIAKIETKKGVENIEKIIQKADGIMVARGDLGLDIPLEEVPRVQKKIIRTCLIEGKIVITATQMLESMINNPRPTRAEASDVANAIYDGSTAVMLSGETASGKYPVESLETMVNIINSTEASIDYKRRYNNRRYSPEPDVVNAIGQATCSTAMTLNIKAILSVTRSGHTANMVSNFHPATPIIGITQSEQVRRQLNLLWGVTPILNNEEFKNTDRLFESSIETCKNAGLLEKDDVIIITAGVPTGFASHTNIMKVDIIK